MDVDSQLRLQLGRVGDEYQCPNKSGLEVVFGDG